MHVYKDEKKIKSFSGWFHVMHDVYVEGRGVGGYVKYQTLHGTDLLY